MAKRKYSGEGQTTSDDGSEYEDSGQKSPKKTRHKPALKKPERHSSTFINEDQDNITEQRDQHPLSRHSIQTAVPICSALLDWYAGVHESRGMPWRKPYDPSLGRDGRAQRAYEVRSICTSVRHTQDLVGLDIRDNVATNTSGDRNSVL
jgi:A/G-specific adenine glycosylase